MNKFTYTENDIKGLVITKFSESNEEWTCPHLLKILTDISTGKYDQSSLEKAFDEVAILLLRKTVIVTPLDSFYLREVEFYFYDEVNHPDSYAHKHKRQLKFGEWYFHRFIDIVPFLKSRRNGVDITFGNEQKRNFGGILIRKIQSKNSGDLIVGINNVARQLIFNVGEENVNTIATESGQFAFDRNQRLHIKEESANFINAVYKTHRNGLTFKNDDIANQFFRATYCYYNFNECPSKIIEVRPQI